MEEIIIDQKDMMRLIETEYGHASGDFIKLDNVYDVIQNNDHPAYSRSEETDQRFFAILYDRKRAPDECAEISD